MAPYLLERWRWMGLLHHQVSEKQYGPLPFPYKWHPAISYYHSLCQFARSRQKSWVFRSQTCAYVYGIRLSLPQLCGCAACGCEAPTTRTPVRCQFPLPSRSRRLVRQGWIPWNWQGVPKTCFRLSIQRKISAVWPTLDIHVYAVDCRFFLPMVNHAL